MAKVFIFEYPTLIKVLDGDTLDVHIDVGFGFKAENKRIRLNKIDAPETRTRNKLEKKAGLKVKKYVFDLLTRNKFKVISETVTGTYGARIMGDIIFKENIYLSQHLLDIKYARIYLSKVNGKRVPWSEKSLQYIIDK